MWRTSGECGRVARVVAPRGRRAILVVLLGALAGSVSCVRLGTSWRAVAPEHRDARPPAQERYQVWRGSDVVVLHGVAFGRGSIRGVPAAQHRSCVLCRVAIPVTAVDSVRVGSQPASIVAWAALHVLLVGAVFFFLHALPST